VLEQLLATQTRSLDRAQLKGNAPASVPDAMIQEGMVPHVFTWPPKPPVAQASTRSVPDVRGLTIRAAARRLHEEGLQTRVKGWGTVRSTTPEAGTSVKVGSSVLLTAEEVK